MADRYSPPREGYDRGYTDGIAEGRKRGLLEAAAMATQADWKREVSRLLLALLQSGHCFGAAREVDLTPIIEAARWPEADATASEERSDDE